MPLKMQTRASRSDGGAGSECVQLGGEHLEHTPSASASQARQDHARKARFLLALAGVASDTETRALISAQGMLHLRMARAGGMAHG